MVAVCEILGVSGSTRPRHDPDHQGGADELVNDANRDQFLTDRWSNILAISLGLPALVFALVALTTGTVSDRAAFIGLVVVGAFY